MTLFLKLLVIPFLFVQFRRSSHGEQVFLGYLISCVTLLVATTVVRQVPQVWDLLTRHQVDRVDDVLVKNAATQSGEFVTCIFGLLFLVHEALASRRWQLSLGLVAVICAMLASIFYVSAGRTALAVIPVLLVAFALKKLRGKSIILVFAGAILDRHCWLVFVTVPS